MVFFLGFCSGDSVTRYIVSAFPSSDFVDICDVILVKANAPTHKPEKLHESMNSSYITQLERKIRDRDNTIKLIGPMCIFVIVSISLLNLLFGVV
jgi:macrodomain Ter protein organizer (MatP/YcbG family)